LHAAAFLVSSVKLPKLQLKTRPKQLLGYRLLDIALLAPTFIKGIKILLKLKLSPKFANFGSKNINICICLCVFKKIFWLNLEQFWGAIFKQKTMNIPSFG
jgi:hypothetical protein